MKSYSLWTWFQAHSEDDSGSDAKELLAEALDSSCLLSASAKSLLPSEKFLQTLIETHETVFVQSNPNSNCCVSRKVSPLLFFCPLLRFRILLAQGAVRGRSPTPTFIINSGEKVSRTGIFWAIAVRSRYCNKNPISLKESILHTCLRGKRGKH